MIDITEYCDNEMWIVTSNERVLLHEFVNCDDEDELREFADRNFTYREDQFDELVVAFRIA